MKILIPLVAGFFLMNAQNGVLFIDRILYGEWDGKTGDACSRVLNLMFFASGALICAYGSFVARRKSPMTGTALSSTYIALLMASALWSTDSGSTLRVGAMYVFLLLGIIGLTRTMDVGQFMKILCWVCLAGALMSIALAIIMPSSAFIVGAGATDYRGIFPHKNALGQVMATGAFACLYVLRTEPRGRLGRVLMLALFTVMAVAARSTAALLVTLSFIAMSLYFWMRQKSAGLRQIANLAAIAIAPVVLFVVLAPDTALEMIGKDPTLTGRTEIWGYVWGYIVEKPLLGWGYFGFWNMFNPAAIAISDAMGWTVPQAHNGVLELLLSIGFLGTGFALFLFIRNAVLGFRCLGGPQREAGIAMIMCCTGLLMEGVSEPVLLAPNESLTCVFFALGIFCEQVLAERRRSARVSSKALSRGAFPALPVFQRSRGAPGPTYY